MKACVEQVANGFTVTTEVDGETQVFVFEDEDNESSTTCFASVLWELVEAFGMGGSRYDKKRIRVRVEPGDKYEEPV